MFPGAWIVEDAPLAIDDGGEKGAGYGLPRRVVLVDRDGTQRTVVFRTASTNDFGHDRRSDRAQELLLAWDTFDQIPRHVIPLDVGAIRGDGTLVSLADAGELYLITTFAPGRPYATDLRRIGSEKASGPLDERRCEALARYLVELHAPHGDLPAGYTRAIRDLVGHGEGIFGVIDNYPPNVPGAWPERLRSIERRCADWRWRLRGREARLRRTHGDFHPFNVLFEKEVDLHVLDASRGAQGDPADDVTCMAINYVFFALDHPGSWKLGFRPLWRRFLDRYLEGARDPDLLACAPPFLAWRGLVIANPRFYPNLSATARDALLSFVERTLDVGVLDPDAADKVLS